MAYDSYRHIEDLSPLVDRTVPRGNTPRAVGAFVRNVFRPRQSIPQHDVEFEDFATSSSSRLSVNRSGGDSDDRSLSEHLRVWSVHSDRPPEKQGLDESDFAVGKDGWWNGQMLIDKSLRSMAALTAFFALILTTLCVAYFPAFLTRLNRHSTSVGGNKGHSCSSLERSSAAIHLFINISATAILGMSNTYQQLVTSFDASEIRWVLRKFGDARLGTNSPTAINRKRKGRPQAWLAWILLISTSLPIHLLANSIIGPSLYNTPPKTINYQSTSTVGSGYEYYAYEGDGVAESCWGAFRTGHYIFTDFDSAVSDLDTGPGFQELTVTYYGDNCTTYLNSTPSAAVDVKQNVLDKECSLSSTGYDCSVGNCSIGRSVSCTGNDFVGKCRLSVRMQPVIILTVCLLIKATYMIIVNVRARKKVKSQCLTFGDAVVASAVVPNAALLNECLVDSDVGHRELVNHRCHKHCTNKSESATGDALGHCQKCRKFNIVDKAADLIHPSVAIKFKKSLISNLGLTAVLQMIILMFVCMGLLGTSLALAVLMGQSSKEFKSQCRNPNAAYNDISQEQCAAGLTKYLDHEWGAFGGFSSGAELATLPPNSAGSELASLAISNGAQLIFSILYLLLIYNLTLISMEHSWGKFEKERKRPRCTLVKGEPFEQSYFLQLPKRVLYPMMATSATMHWALGQAFLTRETIWADLSGGHVEFSQYSVIYGTYSVWLTSILIVSMTSVCWWAFTYHREGFIPMMYGSLRIVCAATSDLKHFPKEGIKWGDLGAGEHFRHAGFSGSEVGEIVPGELYCGRETIEPEAAQSREKTD